MNNKDIAIVGISLACPGATTVGNFWRNLRDGVDSITEVPEEVIESFYFGAKDNALPDRFYCNRGGFTPRGLADPLRFGMMPLAAQGADPDQLLSLMLTEQALRDAEVLQRGLSLQNTAVVIGRGNFSGLPQLRGTEIVRMAEQFTRLLGHALPSLSAETLETIKRGYQEIQGRYQGDTATATMPNLVASGVANHFDMHGPAYLIDAACASGIVALQHGSRLLHTGECDIAVIGGMHAAHSSIFWSAFNMMGAMSLSGKIAPFSQDADGLLIGQGAGFLVIKTLERAVADQDRIYAVVKGTAVGSDGGGHSVLITETEGQSRVLRRAWSEAGLDPADVAYIEAHGTATPVGDATEVATLADVFGGSGRQAYLGSVKSNIGHLMPAAGMMGLIKTALALFHREIPPTLHCANPRQELLDSRFKLPAEVVDWKDSGLPLLAGVNAFGFGGINAHAVLAAFDEPAGQSTRYRVARRKHFADEAYVVTAASKEELINKIDFKATQHRIGPLLGKPTDPYRLVIFNPTDERLNQALEIIKHDQPWLGRADIWFTNRPLLEQGGKIAFMFPGWNASEQVEHDSIVDELGIPWPGYVVDDDEFNYKQRSVDIFATSLFIDKSIRATGVKADMYIGHSVGEWHAARACGMLDDSFDKVITDFDQTYSGQLLPEMIPDFKLVAVNTELPPQQWEHILTTVPDVHITHDNCPSQKVLCAPSSSLPQLKDELDAMEAFHQVLPWVSGIHTPYIKPVLDAPLHAMEQVSVSEPGTPLYSAVNAEWLHSSGKNAAELFGALLSQPVLFTQAIEKLYAAGARVFIQVGEGTLPGFVENTLRGREFASISSLSPLRSGIAQLRRIHALLFAMGGAADLDFMGVDAMYQTLKSVYPFPMGAPIHTELKELDQALAEYGPLPAATPAPLPATTMPTTAAGKTVGSTHPGTAAADNSVDSTAANSNMAAHLIPDRVAPTGSDTTQLAYQQMPYQTMGYQTPVANTRYPGIPPRGFTRGYLPNSGQMPYAASPAQYPLPGAATPAPAASHAVTPESSGSSAAAPSDVVPKVAPSPPPTKVDSPTGQLTPLADTRVRKPPRMGTRFEVPLRLNLDDHPYVIDHSIVNQPVDWPLREDLYPVVPLTMSMELLAEIAMEQAPGEKVLKLGPMTAMDFIPVNEPWEGAVKGFWKSEQVLSLSIPGKLMIDVTLGNEYAPPPVDFVEQAKLDIGEPAMEPLSQEAAYVDYSFHRPQYWSYQSAYRFGESGFHNLITKQKGKGSLLDQMGQTIGLFLHLYDAPENKVSFPVRVQSLTFYQDMFDQDGIFEHFCVIRKVTDSFIVGDCIFLRDGRVWAIARGWTNQRVGTDMALWGVVNKPWGKMLSQQLAENVYFYENKVIDRQSLAFLFLRYLTKEEKTNVLTQENNELRGDYLAGRIALKDATRHTLRDPNGNMLYPIEIGTGYHPEGKLFVERIGGQWQHPVEVSVAHKHNKAVAITSKIPVGIDIEKIEPKESGFKKLAFTEAELEILSTCPDETEWVIRLWVAKEAYGKMLGIGFKGDPKRHQVESISGTDVYINGVKIVTMILDGYVIGWTE
jgi:acyl transferase domain-containing protein/phosphopantetheinyl transferase